MISKFQERLKFMATVSYFKLLHTYNTMHTSDFSAGSQREKEIALATGTFEIIPEVHGTAKRSMSYPFIFSCI